MGDGKQYNDAAVRVMKKHKVAINDLHTLTKGFDKALFTKPGDVHYTAEGYKKIAKEVADKVLKAIKSTP